MSSSPIRPLRVLHIDDEPSEAHLARLALAGCNAEIDLYHACSASEALAQLRGSHPYLRALNADLLLLDLNLPEMSGHDLLAIIRQDPALTTLPTIVISTSGADCDRAKACCLGVEHYLLKTLDIEVYSEKLRQLVEWHANHLGIAA